MIQSQPPITRTTHTLSFDKLSPRDFERLCLWLVEREGYQRAEHLGAAGSEQGRDIVAWREGALWAFQCKRVQNFGPKDALVEVEKVLALPEAERPVGLVFLVTCDVSVNARQQARERCGTEMECDFWAGTELDEKVKRHPDILEEFFRAAPPPSLVTTALPPRPPDYFVGRQEILDELKTGLATGSAQAITALQGMGGIGKTAAAQQLALEIGADFPGGVFWADLPAHGGDPSPVLAAWAALCGHDVASLGDPQACAQAVRGMLGARLQNKGRLAAVLDDVREEWLEGAQILKTALPPGVPLVVTTRDEELAYALDAEVRRLDALPMDEALDLLSRLAGAEAVEAELLEARALAERVGRLPLALELAGKLAALRSRKPGWRLATLRAQVEAKASEALKLRGHPGLAATFAVSYEALTEEQQRLFRWLGVIVPGGIRVHVVAGMLGNEEETTGVALDRLVGLALVEWGETAGLYRLHPLLAEYAGTLLEEAGEERTAWEAHLAYREMIQVEKAIEFDEDTLEFARETGNRQGEGSALGGLGNAYRRLGQVERAIEFYEQALEIAREIGDRRGEGTLLGSLGIAYSDLGQVERAIEFYEQALEIAREIGDWWGEGIRLGNLGLACYRLGEVGRARSAWQRAREVLKPLTDQTMPAYVFAGAALGLAISNPGWSDPAARGELLAPVLSACRAALTLSRAPETTVREFLREHVRPLQEMGVERLEPVVALLDEARSS